MYNIYNACNINYTLKEKCLIPKLMNVGFGMFGFYGISTFVGYLMPNPFLYK